MDFWDPLCLRQPEINVRITFCCGRTYRKIGVEAAGLLQNCLMGHLRRDKFSCDIMNNVCIYGSSSHKAIISRRWLADDRPLGSSAHVWIVTPIAAKQNKQDQPWNTLRFQAESVIRIAKKLSCKHTTVVYGILTQASEI